jgi:hypothetical protein
VFCQFDHGSGLCSQVWWFVSEEAIECPRPFVSRNRDRIAKALGANDVEALFS